MDKMKFVVLIAGIVGVIGLFLPFVAMGGQSASLLDIMGLAAGQVILTELGFILALVLGAMGVAGKFTRVFAIICTVGLALSTVKLLDAFGDGAIGAKLMFIAAVLGLLASIAAIVKPESADA